MRNPFHSILRFILKPLGAMLFPVRVMNKDKYKKYNHGQMLVSNHLSWMDVSYQIFGLSGYKRFLSKKENTGGKLQYWFLRKIGIIFVNRDKPELSSMRECINALKEGDTLSVFPEGTRNRVNREIMEMHSGAAMFALKGRATVTPVAIHHKAKLFKRNYMGVGDPVDISDLYDKRLDDAILKEATERFRVGIQKTLDDLDVWVENKGWKLEKKIKKANKRALKLEYKKTKKQARKAVKAEKKANA